jgi:transposase InsO family protein
MKLHANAALSLNRRRLLCERVVVDGWTVTEAAAAAEVSVRCARKWVGRYRAEGESGLLDRSSAPGLVANRTPEERVQAIVALRRLRFTGPEIAELLSMALSTVSGILTRIGMGKLGRLGLEPARRYERARPGELIHVDVKKLGRIEQGAGKRFTGRTHHTPRRTDAAGVRRYTTGWEFVHIAIDDCTRLAYAEVLTDEKATTAIAFLRRALAFFERHGIEVERLLTDNGSAYRSTIHAIACRALGIRHLRTRPYRPQTNGKAERFIRTLLSGWAYSAIYRTSSERTTALDGWLWHYNHQRRHSALGHKPPIAKQSTTLSLVDDVSSMLTIATSPPDDSSPLDSAGPRPTHIGERTCRRPECRTHVRIPTGQSVYACDRLGSRLMARRQPLELVIGVRVPAPQ